MGSYLDSSARVDNRESTFGDLRTGSTRMSPKPNHSSRRSCLTIPSYSNNSFTTSPWSNLTPRSEGELLPSPTLKAFTLNELNTATKNFNPNSMMNARCHLRNQGPVWLHVQSRNLNQKHTKSGWRRRANSGAISAARGLAFLHEAKVSTARGLAFLHEAKVIYRDFNASNILHDVVVKRILSVDCVGGGISQNRKSRRKKKG